MVLSATVDATGISAPTYEEILASLQDSYRAIYGSDVYLEADSQDGQFLAIIASALKDTNDTAIAVYNSFSPATAVGAGLSSVIKVNGITRNVATNSTAVVHIVGQPGVLIGGAIIGDNLSLGTRWSVEPVTIPLSGAIDATATSIDPGAVTAAPGTLTYIATPIPGWQSVTNVAAAVPGDAVETDADLRRRQSRSASFPADTTLNGIYASVADLVGVTRAAVYQNDTNVTDANGIPPHNIAVVVEGGSAEEIASAIALKKPPGIPTQGTAVVTVVDSRGVPSSVRYYPLQTVVDYVLVVGAALPGYMASTANYVKQSVATYINGLDISTDCYLSKLYAAADLTGTAAVLGTGFTQDQLDALSSTYNITVLAQSREDMYNAGAVAAGGTTMTMGWPATLAAGSVVYIALDDGSYLTATVSGVVGNVVTFAPAVPVGRTILDQARVYAPIDVPVAFFQSLRATVDTTAVIIV